MNDSDRLLTRKDLADFLQVHVDEVTRCMKCGMPYYHGIGRGPRFVKTEVLEWLQKFRHNTIYPLRRSA